MDYQKEQARKQSHYNHIKKNKIPKNKLKQGGKNAEYMINIQKSVAMLY